MCHFITGIIDKGTNLDNLNELGHENTINFYTFNNAYIKDQLLKTEDYVAKNCKVFECGTQLGILTRGQSPDPFRIESREIKRLERKGWSETKIQRWIADREKGFEKNRNTYNELAAGTHSEIENWMIYLKNIFSSGQINHFGFLLHWYKSGLEDERIKIKTRKKIKITDLTEDDLLRIEEDVVYDIIR